MEPSRSDTARKKPWGSIVRGVLLVLIVGALFAWGRHQDVEALAQRIQRQGALPFFAAMTLAPLTGLPVTPFYLLAGAVFGERVALLAASAAIAINLLSAYGLMQVAPKGVIRRLRTRFLRRTSHNRKKALNPWILTLLVRATPGPTIAMRNYFLGLSGVPILPYMVVSWPLSMAYAAALILLGDSAFEGHRTGLLAGLAALLIVAGTVFFLRRWADRRANAPADG